MLQTCSRGGSWQEMRLQGLFWGEALILASILLCNGAVLGVNSEKVQLCVCGIPAPKRPSCVPSNALNGSPWEGRADPFTAVLLCAFFLAILSYAIFPLKIIWKRRETPLQTPSSPHGICVFWSLSGASAAPFPLLPLPSPWGPNIPVFGDPRQHCLVQTTSTLPNPAPVC